MFLLSLTVKSAPKLTRRAAQRGREGVNNPCFLQHIYHQLYKNHQKPDPFSGSCRVQLVTRDQLLQEAFNSTHVALPVQCGFEDFMRVGQLLGLVRLDKERGLEKKRGKGKTV